MKYRLTVYLFLLTLSAPAQSSLTDFAIRQLKDHSPQQVMIRKQLHDSLGKMDSAHLLSFLNELTKAAGNAGKFVKCNLTALKARLLFYKLVSGDSIYASQMKEALRSAHELEEPFLIAEYSRWYGEMLYSLKKKNEAVQYAYTAMVLQEQSGFGYFPDIPTFHLSIGDMFLRTRNWSEAAAWIEKGLRYAGKDSLRITDRANALNNLGLAFVRLKNFAKAGEAYNHCIQFSKANQLHNWYLTAKYNLLSPLIELQRFDSCQHLLMELEAEMKNEADPNIAASLFYIKGMLANRQKRYADAVNLLKQAEDYGQKTGNNGYRYNLCKELSAAFNGTGQYEQSLLYYKEYKHIDDSMRKAEALIKKEYLETKAVYEKEQLELSRIKKDRSREILIRNTGIIILIILMILAILLLNRRQKKIKQKASEQLLRFREDIIEKDRRIDALQSELDQQSSQTGQLERIEELSQQIILTEADWERFQDLFRQTYPAFLHTVKQKFPGITEAETRMACLIKLQLNTRQIAAMQGISADTVYKTRQRLRQRLSAASTTELDTLLLSL